MFLYTLVSEYDIFPSAPQNSTAFPIDNGVIYRTDGNFSGIFSTDPFDYLNISNFQNGGFFGGNNQQAGFSMPGQAAAPVGFTAGAALQTNGTPALQTIHPFAALVRISLSLFKASVMRLADESSKMSSSFGEHDEYIVTAKQTSNKLNIFFIAVIILSFSNRVSIPQKNDAAPRYAAHQCRHSTSSSDNL